jgi:hypothetical protein
VTALWDLEWSGIVAVGVITFNVVVLAIWNALRALWQFRAPR